MENTYRNDHCQDLLNIYQNLPPFEKWLLKC